jgi:2-polyprenyl-3-methyl-5-hydroxy-6-metoxy-1,4-benzoquinol methylase
LHRVSLDRGDVTCENRRPSARTSLALRRNAAAANDRNGILESEHAAMIAATSPAFRFGDNWLQFATSLGEEQIEQAVRSLQRLLGRERLDGLAFLDIGCGSGLFSLAARRLGASVRAFDADPDSVQCSLMVRERYRAGDEDWTISQGSVLDEEFLRTLGEFDVVYAWGVLHHTGAMWQALRNACRLVKSGGTICVALYRRTPCCTFWRREKAFYASAPRFIQQPIAALYKSAYFAGLLATRRNPFSYVRQYHRVRGMSFSRDVHDWLGGFPYESAEPGDVVRALEAQGLRIERSFVKPGPLRGLLGTHCDEYCARKP